MYKATTLFLAILCLISCENRKTNSPIQDTSKTKILDSISGFYKTEIDSNYSETCELSVEIRKNKNQYTYHLKTDLRDVKGKVGFVRDSPNELYIVFEGIEWDEYLGDETNEIDDDVEEKNTKIPVGIEAYVGNDTLTIQNNGNAMNSYTKIGECGRKYIFLIKQNHR